MSNLEIVNPVVVNEIEFYVSRDRTKRGISQIGCARLCGLSESAMRSVINALGDRHKTPPKSLEHLHCGDLSLALTSPQQAKVIDSKVVASLVSYYAFERGSEVAKYSLQKFATMGIDTWIDSIVGLDSSNESHRLLESINATMGKMMIKLERLETIEEETLGYRKATVKLPILEKWMAELGEQEKQKLLAPATEDLISIKEAMKLIKPNLVVDSTIAKKLALKVSQTIQALSGEPIGKTKAKNGKGYTMQVNGYSRTQLPLIKLCYHAVLIED